MYARRKDRILAAFTRGIPDILAMPKVEYEALSVTPVLARRATVTANLLGNKLSV